VAVVTLTSLTRYRTGNALQEFVKCIKTETESQSIKHRVKFWACAWTNTSCLLRELLQVNCSIRLSSSGGPHNSARTCVERHLANRNARFRVRQLRVAVLVSPNNCRCYDDISRVYRRKLLAHKGLKCSALRLGGSTAVRAARFKSEKPRRLYGVVGEWEEEQLSPVKTYN